MFENLAIIAALAIGFWIVSFVVYGYSSRRQKDLEAELQALNERLDQPDQTENQ